MLNATEAASAEEELEPLVAQPRDADVGLVETGGNEQRVVSTFLELHADRLVVDRDQSGGVDEVLEQVPIRRTSEGDHPCSAANLESFSQAAPHSRYGPTCRT